MTYMLHNCKQGAKCHMVCDGILGKGNPFETDDLIVPRPVEWGLSEEEAD